ncbi:MAG: hypothetical protein QOC99_3019 [Acidobacteriota bacterium]|nr:hypothetical protein [Acidobacteriota bacterium]
MCAVVCPGVRACFDAAQTRALRVEQASHADSRRAVVEEREQFDDTRESTQQRLRYQFHLLVKGLFRGMKTGRRSVQVVCDHTYAGKSMDEFRACALAVREEARDVTSVDAEPCDEQVVARAPRDAA